MGGKKMLLDAQDDLFAPRNRANHPRRAGETFQQFQVFPAPRHRMLRYN
jgi:hypothetical protein